MKRRGGPTPTTPLRDHSNRNPMEHQAVPSASRELPLWWEGTQDYWNLPFFAEMNACCDAQNNPDDALAAREALWAIRENCDDDIGEK